MRRTRPPPACAPSRSRFRRRSPLQLAGFLLVVPLTGRTQARRRPRTTQPGASLAAEVRPAAPPARRSAPAARRNRLQRAAGVRRLVHCGLLLRSHWSDRSSLGDRRSRCWGTRSSEVSHGRDAASASRPLRQRPKERAEGRGPRPAARPGPASRRRGRQQRRPRDLTNLDRRRVGPGSRNARRDLRPCRPRRSGGTCFLPVALAEVDGDDRDRCAARYTPARSTG